MKLSQSLFIGVGVLSMFTLTNCNEKQISDINGESSFASDKGTLSFYLKDAPSDELKSVFVNIDSIQIFYEFNGQKKRYDMVNSTSQLIDLMSLRDGLALKIKEIPFSPGAAISSLRLVLNPEGNSAVRIDDSICELKTPSAQQSGLKIKLSKSISLEENSDYSLVLDFDVDKSVVINPQKCLLKPVLKLEALLQNISDDAGEDDVVADEDESDGNSDSTDEPVSDNNDEGDTANDPVADADEPEFDYTNDDAIVDVIDLPGDEVLNDSEIIQDTETEDAPSNDENEVVSDFIG